MKWVHLLLLGVLVFALSLFVRRESFTEPGVSRPASSDAGLVSKIKAEGPIGVDVEAYVRVLQKFYDNVYTPAPNKPTTQMVDTFLNGSEMSLTPQDKTVLRQIILQVFKIQSELTAAQREAQQVIFQPSASALQDSMAASSQEGGPGATDVGETVFTQLGQLNPLGRGGSGAAYAIDLQAYNEDTPLAVNATQRSSSSTGTPFRTSMESEMAGATVPTRPLYGPRVPKERGEARKPSAVAPLDPSRQYPDLIGPPDGKGREPSPFVGNNALGTTTPLPEQGQGPQVTFPNMPKFEPLPVLADFSKIYQ